MRRRYYSRLRPVAPGTYPTRGVVEIVNFDTREWVEEAGCRAWGYIVYDRELTPDEIDEYELAPEKEENNGA